MFGHALSLVLLVAASLSSIATLFFLCRIIQPGTKKSAASGLRTPQTTGTHVRNPLEYASLLVRFELWRDTELEEP